MEIGLFMMVKDESKQIHSCLAEIVDLFRQIVVVDTGSTDGTPDELRALGIEPTFDKLCPTRCYSHAELRNRGFAQLRTPWILSLDADERVERSTLESLLCCAHRSWPAMLSPWINWKQDGTFFEDYKCSLFRADVQMRGLIHDNVQIYLRALGRRAGWEHRLVINHYPDWGRFPKKQDWYHKRLRCAIALDPNWLRYRWFLGYSLFRMGRLEAAIRELMVLHVSRSHLFPVECLNASMVLAESYARRGQHKRTLAVLDEARAFYGEVGQDFEVCINFRLEPWLQDAWEAAHYNELDRIQAYEFAF